MKFSRLTRAFLTLAGIFGTATTMYIFFSHAPGLTAELPSQRSPSDLYAEVSPGRGNQAFGIGQVEPSGESRALAAKTGGVVRKVHVKPGDRVEAGTLLVELDDATWKAELAIAISDLALAKAEEVEAAVGINEFRILAAQRSLERAQERLRHANAEYERLLGIGNGQAVSKIELDAAQTAKKQADLDVQAQEAEIRHLKGFVTPEQKAVMAAKVESAKARIRSAEERLRTTQLVAPFTGTVLRVLKREGEGVRNTDPEPILLFADISQLRIRAEIDEHYADRMAVGQTVEIAGRNLAGRTSRGKVVRVEPSMGTKSLFTRAASERKDVDVREIIIEPEEGFTAPVGLKVEVEIDLARQTVK